MTARRSLGLWIALAVAACGGEGTGPQQNRVTLAIQSGDAQFGAPGQEVAEPLQVIVTDAVSRRPVQNVTVTWSVVSGSGAFLNPSQSTTDENGVARTFLRLGQALGDYHVEARASNMTGTAPRFMARAVEVPVITDAPTEISAGETITITGTGFSTQASQNTVLFGGFPGQIVSATATQLRVVVPQCLPERTLTLQVALGAVSSQPVTVEVSGSTGTPIDLEPGEVVTLTSAAELACVVLPGGIGDYEVIAIPHNASATAGSIATLRLAGLYAGGPVTSIAAPAARMLQAQPLPFTFEESLRAQERKMLKQEQQEMLRVEPQMSTQAACPAPTVGSQCTFKVLDGNQFKNVTAQLKAVSTRALVYQDVEAPANGLTDAQFESIANTFDDPIYAAVTAAFGTPTDIDQNNRIIILLTPVVNAMTPRNSGGGFIAGFFYGCDLVSQSVCSGTNRAEIFYTLTADPTGQFGDARSAQSVINAIMPVLAHEFQHMIAFGYRNNTDVLWLSEGMAHHAEDIVADEFAERGDNVREALFRAQNFARARRYLIDPDFTGLVVDGGQGSLELRGAGWLFVKYLAGRFGNSILASLTQSNATGVNNVVQRAGIPWNELFADWAVALYADNAPELSNVTVDARYTFPNINLRTSVLDQGQYALRPQFQAYSDFVFSRALPASSPAYLRIQAVGAGTQPLHLNLAGQYGGAFAEGSVPQLSILRLK